VHERAAAVLPRAQQLRARGRGRAIAYDEAHALSLDLYPAQGAKGPAPVVLFFYGGTWRDGRREYYRFVGEALAARGVLVLIPDYRKAPADHFPAFMEDAAAAAGLGAQARRRIRRRSRPHPPDGPFRRRAHGGAARHRSTLPRARWDCARGISPA
jgi:acetyl esterase/lipase